MSPHTQLAARVRWRAALLRTCALAVAVALMAVSAVAVAVADAALLDEGSRGTAVKQLQRKLGVSPVSGYYGSKTKAAVTRFQRRRRLAADGIAGPATLRALGIRVRSSRSTGGTSADSGGSSPRLPAVLKRIAQCESGGNPRAVSPGGRYRGKYQFDRATWRAWGGEGDPARAAESVQDRIALRLYRSRGTAPWPNCA